MLRKRNKRKEYVKMKKNLVIGILCIMTTFMFGCNKNKTIILRDAEPFWLSNTIKNESVLILEEAGEYVGNLAFNPKKILSVKDSTLTKEFTIDKDFVVKGQKIIRAKKSEMPYLKKDVLYGINMPRNEGLSTQPTSAYGKDKGYEAVLYTESAFLFKNQVFVTYTYDKTDSSHYAQSYLGNQMPNTMNILNSGEKLNIVVYGDSIATGCNASGSELLSVYTDPNSQYTSWGIEPFGKSFPELFAEELNYLYDSEIELLSASKGGVTSDWGKQNALTRAYNPDYGYTPDLVLIHFGVNDSSMFINEDTFKQNIISIIEDIRSTSKKPVEFILIGAMFANKDAVQIGKETNYYIQLEEIAKTYEGVISVNVGTIHQRFLENKNYVDLTSNNVNHPNDYLHRIYAMVLNAALIDYEDA